MPAIARTAAGIRRAACRFCAALLITAAAGTAWGGDDALRTVAGPCHLQFPADHGAHGDYRSEWWYYTGNLEDAAGRAYGFQLTFFRTRLPAPPEAPPAGGVSAWRTPQIYLAHAAVTDVGGATHVFAEQMARGTLGLAGVTVDGDAVTVAAGKWSARIGPAAHWLTAAAEGFDLDLTLAPRKPPIAHGEDGFSRKGNGPGQASCYYSFTRLAVNGMLRVGGRTAAVTGLAWMDHEFATAPLDADLVGWDWLGLQLDDGSDVMLYRLRDARGNMHPASSGTVVDAGGGVRTLSRDDFEMTPAKIWESPDSGGRYPVGWTVRIPPLGVVLDVTAPVAAQEMRTDRSAGVAYWEGTVRAAGRAGEKPLAGKGYLEMTGYGQPFRAPM